MTKSGRLTLDRRIVDCQRCPRLREHCQMVALNKRRAYHDETYWGRPVANFGARRANLLVVGLAPGAHGANRTGRLFTGDRSGDWLYAALYRQGFANQPQSTSLGDGLKLRDCLITCVCHCAPPDNKPTKQEITACSSFLAETIQACHPQIIVALGGLAWNAVIPQLVQMNWLAPPKPRPKFLHGAKLAMEKRRWLLGSYHPSQQNTFTGRLTVSMFDSVFQTARQLIESTS